MILTQKTCSRGHAYTRSSDCPVCPKCWPGYYEKHSMGDFDTLSAPAQRALMNAGIKTLKQLGKKTEKEIASLHGMGPKGIRILKESLREKGLGFHK